MCKSDCGHALKQRLEFAVIWAQGQHNADFLNKTK